MIDKLPVIESIHSFPDALSRSLTNNKHKRLRIANSKKRLKIQSLSIFTFLTALNHNSQLVVILNRNS